MRFFKATNLILLAIVMLGYIPGEKEQAEGIHLELLLLLPMLLIKMGLAAPVVLALLAKLLLLMGLKKKGIALPLLLPKGGGGHTTTASYKAPPSEDNLGRIKRSVDFVQGIVGETDVSEEKLLEKIFKMDSMRCGEKLLCEVASSTSSRKAKDIDEDEAAMLSLFTETNAVKGEKLGPAQRAYRNAVVTGFKTSDCLSQYPSCPFGKALMMQLVHLVIGTDISQNIPLSSTTTTNSKREFLFEPLQNRQNH